ncbi:MAG: PAS domain-containing sensor histidine kinase [Putridiphycobacter sp.]
MDNILGKSSEKGFFKLLFENISEGLIVVNKNREIVEVNHRMTEMFGFTYDELIGNDLNVLIPDDIKSKHNKYVEGYNQKPERKQMGVGRVLKAQRKDKTLFHIETSLNHLQIEGETFYVALLTDISKRVEAETELKNLNENLEKTIKNRTKELFDSQALYTAVARNFPNGTINVFDEDLNYIFAEGKELYKMGITSKKLIGTSYLKRLPEDVKSEIEKELRAVFNNEVHDFELETKGQIYHINAVPLKGKGNKIDKILVVETNVTKEKLASKQLKESLAKEKEINEMKSRFVSMASHQFRTPLTTILSSVSLIDSYIQRQRVEATEKHIKRIKSSVKGLTDILNDFLSSDKLESNMVNVNIKPIDFKPFLSEIIEELQAIAKENQHIQLNLSLEHDVLNSDTNILKNIIYNLINNAIKYSEAGQNIIVNAIELKQQLKIEVIDAGIGIPKDDQENLFGRFYRATNAQNHKGTGLGLNIVKSYLDLLNGNITFESEENKGTKFTVKIPLKHD